ncbi:methyltransferase domain-containing protein [Paenibacillus sp. FSL W8-0426]|uniref:glycosyltransferase family protein n=1 Tax=Paenibacillus sp. FSL W8-0426 TaxID=2921714 RepID=UPI0030DA02C9
MKIAFLQGKGQIGPHVIHDYAQAFEEVGAEVLTVPLDGNFNTIGYHSVLNFKPDYIIGYGYKGIIRDKWGDFVWRNSGIPVICLHYDNPIVVLDKVHQNEFIENPSFYYHFVWDSYFQRILIEKGINRVHPILLATNPRKFHPIPDIQRQENQLAFVGSMNLCPPFDQMNYHIEQRFIDYVIHQKSADFHIPVYDICMKALSLEEFQPIAFLYKNYPEEFWTNIYGPIHVRGSSIFRRQVLGSLIGVDMHIYGSQQKLNEYTINHPAIPYEELSQVYQLHAVNLNISSLQLETSVNNRVFDVFASKGFVLSDYKKDMELVFPDAWEAISFVSLEDLLVKADYYLTHRNEREELVGELYNHILDKHTYKHRANEIIGVLSSYESQGPNRSQTGTTKGYQYKDELNACPICSGQSYAELYHIEGHDRFDTSLHRCNNCGSVFMDPQPTEEYLTLFYQNMYYSKEHRQKMGWSTEISDITPGMMRNYEIRMDLVESFVNQTRYPRGVLLDIGCSTGHFLAEAQFRYWTVAGIEVSEKAANEGRENYGLNIITGTLNDELYEDESFDVVTAWDVIEHIPTPHNFMKNVKRILKKGGLFVANTPNVNSSASYHRGSQWRHLDPPLHVILYDHISLRILMKMHDFEILQISSGSEYLGQLQIVARKN